MPCSIAVNVRIAMILLINNRVLRVYYIIILLMEELNISRYLSSIIGIYNKYICTHII